VLTTPKTLLDELLELGSATVYEAARAGGAVDPGIRPAWNGARVCGPAFTVECAFGDNLAVHIALEQCRGGEVLVANAHAHLAGYCGEVLAVAAQARGVLGLVVDGGVRDSAALERLGFPVFARGLSIAGTVKHEPGRTREPVVVGGVAVRSGDIVVADEDGVVIVAPDGLEAVLEQSRARVAREGEIMNRLRAGELTLDLLGLRPRQ
jgi:4-hydroxy-4-methyl-2-oxoglutarate aldolase